MKSYPLVSVIIPLYNSEQYIAETIESVLNQTYKNVEIIVIDDGSLDKSLEVVYKYKSKGIKIYSEPNRGASAARNMGIQYASGNFIQFLDADDILHPDKIKNQVCILINEDSNTLVFCKWIRFFQSADNSQYKRQEIDKDYSSPFRLLKDMWNGKGMVQPGAWIASKELLMKAGEWNENLSLNDDGEYFSRVILASSKVRFCDTSIVYYRSGIHNSLSKALTFPAVISQLNSLNCYISNCEKLPCFNEMKPPLALSFSRFIYEYNMLYPELSEIAKRRIFELGYKNIPITGGYFFKMTARLIGFERALRLKALRSKRLFMIAAKSI